MDITTFGNVLRINEEEYVFLGQTIEIVYLAKIPDINLSQRVMVRENILLGGQRPDKASHSVYNFVVLTTEEFKQRIAHLASPGQDASVMNEALSLIGHLNEDDCTELKKKILESMVPETLKVIVRAS